MIAKTLQRNSLQAAGELCEPDGDGGLRIRHDPPIVWRFAELDDQWHGGEPLDCWINHGQATYFVTLRPDMRHLLNQFRLVDLAVKAVGGGSVGTRCAIGLFAGETPEDVLLLQSKQAETSALAYYLRAEIPAHQGERVVQGQRLMQTASDTFLGWATNMNGQHFYRRHFRDWKGSVNVAALDAEALGEYGKLCAWTLAKAHARSGKRRGLAAYLEAEAGLIDTLQDKCLFHANQAEKDHCRLLQSMDYQ